MLKKHMAACLVASAFLTVPVLAQTSTTPGATPPATSAPAAGMGAGSGAAAGGKFITEQQGTQWRASRLIGLDVYGANNEKIGDVNEVLVDRQGNADAVVVGVGGFLGIGEKNVALPFSAFEWQMEDTRRTASSAGSGTAGSGTGSTAATGTTATTGTSQPAATASTSPAGSGASASAQRGYPDHAILRMTKADLEGAPTFRYVGDRAESGSGSGAAGTGASSPSTAPKQ
jgi:septal ring-binding cell division protein DamX